MTRSPFPQGTALPDGAILGRAVAARDGLFYIHSTKDKRRVLLIEDDGFGNEAEAVASVARIPWGDFVFAGTPYRFIVLTDVLDVLDRLRRPGSYEEAIQFASALAAATSTLGNAIFCAELACLLPFSDVTVPARDKSHVLGRYLTGGVEVAAADIVGLRRILPKVPLEELEAIIKTAGIEIKATGSYAASSAASKPFAGHVPGSRDIGPFVLPGRCALSEFFNEHVVDIIADEARYAALGIGFPGAIILEGPTGCGKTFAIERLIEHLGWSAFSIEASSVASPYIHETSRKVAEIFAAAIAAAPAVIVIDEMDAFLSSRDAGAHQHHIEEVAEFLRRIPEAGAKRVLVVGMTNSIDTIDPAILRRGRFDHVIHVDYAEKDEVAGLLEALLAGVANDVGDLPGLAQRLAGRPLSDVSFVIREAGRRAARARKERIGNDDIHAALAMCPSRTDTKDRIGF